VLAATEPVRATGLLRAGGGPGIFNWRPIEAGALIGLGRLDDAAIALSEFEDAIPGTGLASAALALARCRGNLALASGHVAQAEAAFTRGPHARGARADAAALKMREIITTPSITGRESELGPV
jgi:hypothetical protein